jgi:hypothetical protein
MDLDAARYIDRWVGVSRTSRSTASGTRPGAASPRCARQRNRSRGGSCTSRAGSARRTWRSSARAALPCYGSRAALDLVDLYRSPRLSNRKFQMSTDPFCMRPIGAAEIPAGVERRFIAAGAAAPVRERRRGRLR